MRMRFVPAAHPDHALHQLGREITMQDLRAHRQLVVRETGSRRATPPSLEAVQRWTVSNMSTSIIAARSGYGYAWLPEDRSATSWPRHAQGAALRDGVSATRSLLVSPLAMRGPHARLAGIVRNLVQSECPG